MQSSDLETKFFISNLNYDLSWKLTTFNLRSRVKKINVKFIEMWERFKFENIYWWKYCFWIWVQNRNSSINTFSFSRCNLVFFYMNFPIVNSRYFKMNIRAFNENCFKNVWPFSTLEHSLTNFKRFYFPSLRYFYSK